MNLLHSIYYLTARRFELSKNWPQAIKYYHKAQNDHAPLVNYRLGFCYEKQKDYTNASAFLNKALEYESTKAHWYFRSAKIHIRMKKFHEAMIHFKCGLNIDTNKKHIKNIKKIRENLNYIKDEKYIYLDSVKQKGNTLLFSIVGQLDNNDSVSKLSLLLKKSKNYLENDIKSYTIESQEVSIDSFGWFTAEFIINLDPFILHTLSILHTYDFYLNIDTKHPIKYFNQNSTIFSYMGHDFAPYKRKHNNFSLIVIRKNSIKKPFYTSTYPTITFVLSRIDFRGGVTKVTLDLANTLAEINYSVTIIVLEVHNKSNKFPISKKVHFDYISLSGGKENELLPKNVYSNNQIISPSSISIIKEYFSHLKAEFIYIPIYGKSVFTSILEAIPSHVKKIIADHSSRRYAHYDDLLRAQEEVTLNKMLRLTNDSHLIKNLSMVNALHIVNPLVKSIYAQITDIPILDIPNIVDVYQKNQKEYFMRERKIILIGRLDESKNFHTVILAFEKINRQFPNWTLEIYGEGLEKKPLQDLINSLQLKTSIYLKGFSSNVAEVLQNSMIHISASHKESFGLTMVEAMSHHVITISTLKTIGARFLIEDEKTGFLAFDNNEIEIYITLHKVISLIEKKDSIIENIKNSAYTHALQFNAKNTGVKWDNALKNLA